ncbi:response regulator [Herbidospora sp. NEAU-GS84]|uniref:Response regulator n=1 Tax=Herbidospora solisilvae TaxID=2696284 RepID=A0A7C9J0U7_9ACTN|nr:response regulator transcription factor [Herbidospora solisilvae]NAS21262.1 response regulator [Herbidospora solisilvae]
MRVTLAEDNTLLREGLVRLLDEAGFTVVGAHDDAAGLLRSVAEHRPDVAIVDIRLPPTRTDEGLRAAGRIRRLHPGTGVLVLSQYVRLTYTVELLDGGAKGVGYLLKDRVTDLAELTAAVRQVGGGGAAFDPIVIDQLVGRRDRPDDPLNELSERERAVLSLMAEGRTNQAIATRLGIAERTVEKHCSGIFAKLTLPAHPDDHRRVLAVLRYLNG